MDDANLNVSLEEALKQLIENQTAILERERRRELQGELAAIESRLAQNLATLQGHQATIEEHLAALRALEDQNRPLRQQVSEDRARREAIRRDLDPDTLRSQIKLRVAALVGSSTASTDPPVQKRPPPEQDEDDADPGPQKRSRMTRTSSSTIAPTASPEGIEFDQVFANGNAEIKYRIVDHPRGSNNWWILRCLEHNKHFDGNDAMSSATRHISSGIMSHNLPRKEMAAIQALGVPVLNCDASKAQQNNTALQQAKAAGYIGPGYRARRYIWPGRQASDPGIPGDDVDPRTLDETEDDTSSSDDDEHQQIPAMRGRDQRRSLSRSSNSPSPGPTESDRRALTTPGFHDCSPRPTASPPGQIVVKSEPKDSPTAIPDSQPTEFPDEAGHDHAGMATESPDEAAPDHESMVDIDGTEVDNSHPHEELENQEDTIHATARSDSEESTLENVKSEASSPHEIDTSHPYEALENQADTVHATPRSESEESTSEESTSGESTSEYVKAEVTSPHEVARFVPIVEPTPPRTIPDAADGLLAPQTYRKIAPRPPGSTVDPATYSTVSDTTTSYRKIAPRPRWI